jgi:tRNA-specific 2-thiouridylase
VATIKISQQKVLVGMSGGVDSSMAALLLKEQGYDVIGATLSLPRWKESDENKAIENAKKVCEKLEIPHYTIDAVALFQDKVVEYFKSEYKSGKTPNPCVVCNRFVKFHSLFKFAKEKGIALIATGHYAIIRQNAKSGKTELLKGKDKLKDQSYYLSFLTQRYLSQLILPLGEHTKKEVYELAEKHGFRQFKKTDQSQDFCYLSGHSTEEYLEENLKNKPGPIVDESSKKIGAHEGLACYTIGQRRGIRLSGGPFFVKKVDITNNTLVVTKDESALASKEAILSPFNIISEEKISKPLEVTAQIRYKAKPVKAIAVEKNSKLHIKFKTPVYALTPGQLCAIYQGEICIGGGFMVELPV